MFVSGVATAGIEIDGSVAAVGADGALGSGALGTGAFGALASLGTEAFALATGGAAAGGFCVCGVAGEGRLWIWTGGGETDQPNKRRSQLSMLE